MQYEIFAPSFKNPMPSIKTQEQFETMWFLEPTAAPMTGMRATDKGWIQYHTASWCGACKRLNHAEIAEAAKKQGLTVWKIDVDENDYTSGYCGVRSIPTFQFCIPRKIVSSVQDSRTESVVGWINGL
jgi:thiol-disulfide isomerase/thioredoxin